MEVRGRDLVTDSQDRVVTASEVREALKNR